MIAPPPPPPTVTSALPMRGNVSPKGKNQKTAWKKFTELIKWPAGAGAASRNGVPEDVLIKAVAEALPGKPDGRDRRRQQASQAIEGMRKTGWVEIIEAGGVRHVVPGPRAGSLGSMPEHVPEMTKMPDLGVSDNLSTLGSIPDLPDFPLGNLASAPSWRSG